MSAATMKAIVYSNYGGPEQLQLKDVEKPQPADNEVLVKIIATSINSWDWDLLRGKPHLFRLLFGLFRPKLKILGADIAGIVEAVGKNVTQFKQGDEVMGDISDRFGGFAEYVCAAANTLVLKPSAIPFEDAAAIPQAAVLALQALRDVRPIRKGDKLLINGAGGGVGTFVIQMAKSMGAEVTAVDSAEKRSMLQSLGADHVIDYKTTDFTKNGLQYDQIIDVVADRSVFSYRRSLKADGICIIVGGTVPALLGSALLGSFSAKKCSVLIHKPNKNLELINEMYLAGTAVPVLGTVYPFVEAAAAMRHLGEGKAKGKVVINITNMKPGS
jgi:NADPH:quinone reductase-like Zn-dependent oxidoreductase